MRRAFALATAALLAAGIARGQQLQVTAGALAYAVRQGSPTEAEVQSGTWLGVQASATVQRFTFTARGLSGSLGGNPLRVDRDVRLTQLAFRFRVKAWLAVGVDGEAQRVQSSLATSVWRMYGLGATVSSTLGTAGLHAHADVAAFPASSVVASQSLAIPTRLEIGLIYRVRNLPIDALFTYRMETLNFDSAADLRFGGVMAGVLVRLPGFKREGSSGEPGSEGSSGRR